ncbi:MAG: anaerobic nitric oxide reductase flavorubredoxin [Succiniclasticum sp.]|nr:anaerobic nitric oxide reductase flavorubredoxin [Succiniclasticum sp.]
MGKKVTDKVTWVGKIDWELVTFHGNELSTFRGSSYNSYLVRDQKTVLIDTCWLPFDKEFVANLEREINLEQIDYIVMNHNEIDHSGALPALMERLPNVPIYCTKKGEGIIRGHYHKDWNFVNVKTGDALDLGENKLVFIEAPMLHWPDTMFSYLTGEHILFSNDVFGQHYASEELFNDNVPAEIVYAEALKYYTNIITPYSPMVTRKIKELLDMHVPVSMICPSHGILWRDNPMQIVETYQKWAADYQENQITLIYDTMWNSTRRMAECIAEGIREEDPDVVIKLYNSSKEDKNDIATEVFKSRAILVGSPTINYGFAYSTGGIMELIRGLKFKKKKAAAFGSYGWSGEAVKEITEMLKGAGFAIVNDGIRCQWVPDEAHLEECRAYGREFAKACREARG